jgi:hypothetical protein
VAGEPAVAQGRAVAGEPAVVEVAVSAVGELPVQGASRRAVPVAEGHQARRGLGSRVSASRLGKEARCSSNEERAQRTRLSARKA